MFAATNPTGETALQDRARACLTAMLSRNPDFFESRAALLKYALADGLDIAETGKAQHGRAEDGPVWQYWAQGKDDAPPLVQSCFQSVERHLGRRDIIVVDDSSWRRYVQLDAHIAAKSASMTRTHFSDILRVELLHKYGGTWMDATVFLSDEPPEPMTEAKFFAFTRNADPFLLSSWFMTAQAGHCLIAALKEMLAHYWRENDALIDYFLLHHLFECAVTANGNLAQAWKKGPRYSSYVAHELQHRLARPFDRQTFQAICALTPVHKLTYKIDIPAMPGPSFFQAISTGDPAIFGE